MSFNLDEDFEWFLEQFGAPRKSENATADLIKDADNYLPCRLKDYWQEFGFCSFKDGLFWIVNPTEYAGILELWFEQASITSDEQLSVIARSAFGHLYIWGENSGYKYKIDPGNSLVIELKGSKQQIAENGPTESLQDFFYSTDPDYVDLKDERGTPLFSAAINKFGPLTTDDMFTFEPALFLGGQQTLNSIAKVNIFIQLEILAKMATPTVMDFNGLAKKAFT